MEPLSPALNALRCYCCHCTAFNEQASGLGEINGFLYFFAEAKLPSLLTEKSRGSGPVGIRCETGALTSAACQHSKSGSCLMGGECRGKEAKGQKETITTINNTKINQRTTPKASLSLTAAWKGPARGRSLHCPSTSHPKSKARGRKSALVTLLSSCNEARSGRALLLGWEQGWQQQGWPTKSHLTACQRPFVLPPAEETGLPAEEVARRE